MTKKKTERKRSRVIYDSETSSESELELKSKKRKKVRRSNNLDEYHSASSVHNYMLNDPILDWLKKSNPSSSSSSSSSSTTTTTTTVVYEQENDQANRFFNFITTQGKKFEDRIISQIKDTLDSNNISFTKIANCKEDIRSETKYNETIDAMNDQIGVIYQGVLHGNDNFKAFGSPDLLIRSDVVNLLFDQKIDKVPKRQDKKRNYVVIDIKFCTLKLRADGKFLLNDARMPANKAQVMIYNELLGIAQGFKPRYCYILGRGWKYTSKNMDYECSRFNERLGAIDIQDKDSEYNEKIKKALDWLDSIREEGSEWSWNPPSVPELYPNMCNKYDNSNKQKKKIAAEIEEITQMWNCGVKQRELAHSKGIFKLSDPRLTTEVMGFPQGTNRTKIIDKMLKFNQGLIHKDRVVIPKYIDNNPFDWQADVRVEFFLDFEAFSNIFDDFSVLPNVGGPNVDPDEMSIVFMSGLGVSIKTSDGRVKWEYYNFRIPELSNEHEYEMFDRLYKKIEEKCDEHNIKIENAKIFHWGHIEQSLVAKLYNKYADKHDWKNLCLIDFCRIFQDEAIIIKGVYGFGLKAVGKGLIEYGLINVPSWEDSVSDGLDAMVQAYSVYSNPEQNHGTTVNNLIKYNHTDVRMIEKIINYLRKNHTPFDSDLPMSVITTMINDIKD
jgi:hypothetical protein